MFRDPELHRDPRPNEMTNAVVSLMATTVNILSKLYHTPRRRSQQHK